MIRATSFSYKMGEPRARSTLTLDCREMRNPHSILALRHLTGKDQAVQKYVQADPSFDRMMKHAIEKAVDGAHIAFGCFGGRHRSVAMAEMFAALMRATRKEVEVTHLALAQSVDR